VKVRHFVLNWLNKTFVWIYFKSLFLGDLIWNQSIAGQGNQRAVKMTRLLHASGVSKNTTIATSNVTRTLLYFCTKGVCNVPDVNKIPRGTHFGHLKKNPPKYDDTRSIFLAGKQITK